MENTIYSVPIVLTHNTDDSEDFKPLPIPTGGYPYRLNIEKIMGDKLADIRERMFFHMVGDTGSVRHSPFQRTVARTLTEQLAGPLSTRPAFLFHLGDIVYNHGEAHEYPAQFLEPYASYDAPIFAIAGNHDGDINPAASHPYESLEAFTSFFCDNKRRPIKLSNTTRNSMIQPNVYWTLETPLARFIGLYANVTKHGTITAEQRAWFIDELQDAAVNREDHAIFICIHHAPYSTDTNHGSSRAMIEFLDLAFGEAGVLPDAVFSGHVHNYQRFQKTYQNGCTVPYIVAGAGGYALLHSLAHKGDDSVTTLPEIGDSVRLMAHCDTRHGFLKVGIEKTAAGLNLIGSYYTITRPDDVEAKVFDHFEIPLRSSLLIKA